MQSVKLNISDNIFEKFMGLIEILPKGSVVVEDIRSIDIAEDPYIDDRKEMIKKRLNDIDSGKLKTISFDEFEADIDEFEKELESRYAN